MEWWQTVVLLAAALGVLGFLAFIHWLDKPRRDLIAEIKKRPPNIFHVRMGGPHG